MAEHRYIAQKDLGAFFREQLADPAAVFVFSTDVVKNSWVDWCVMHSEESGVSAVPMERFLAWDDFKGTAVRAKESGKASVPALLRKFFVSTLIAQNAASPDGATIFKSLINPDFRTEADSFCGWLSKILPSLKLWHDCISARADYTLDDEDKDYLTLFNRYSDFLNAHDFFEPSWIQPNFAADGKRYIIFYPELLEDYADYITIFENCPEITLVSLPKEDSGSESEQIFCNKFSDARKELRRVILQIRSLSAQNIRWDEIALSVPDLETYRPYLERELSKYCVPFVIRAGFPLVKNTTAQVFTEIQACHNSDFSYDSVRSLILDEYIPWKSEFSTLRQNLISEGSRLRCICGYDEADSGTHFDSWEAALSVTASTNNRELEFYRELKHDISAICKAKSFAGVQTAWIMFRDAYLEKDGFSPIADKIIGRCITELNALIEIENTYCTTGGLSIGNHFEFFINELKAKTYAPQTDKTGVQIFPYKVAAGSYFPEHFVIDSSQRNLEVQYRRLGFLNAEKRRALGLENDDKKFNASKAFIRLYAGLSDGKIRFSYAEDSFSGFAICHNALAIPAQWNEEKNRNEEIANPLEELDEDDFILSEWAYMLGKSETLAGGKKPLKLSLAQKNQLGRWQFFNAPESAPSDYEPADNLKAQIHAVLVENRTKNDEFPDGKIVITQSDMKQFFPCPRKWIFSNVIKLKEDSLDTDLMQPFDMGNINHRILERFMRDYEKSQNPLPVTNADGTFDGEETVLAAVRKHTRAVITESNDDFAASPLTQKMLFSQEEKIALHIMDFLHAFLKPDIPPEKPGTRTKTTGYGGYRVKGVELSLSAKNPESDYNYFGKLDLLLAPSPANPNTEAEGWTIIDYKNSKVPAQKDISLDDEGKLGDFQMPMYITLLRRNKASPQIDVARFYSIKEAKSPSCAVDRNTSGRSEDDFAPTLDAFTEYSEQFAADIQAGALSPNTETVDVYTDCQKCTFKAVCRHNYEVAQRVMPQKGRTE